MSIEILKSCPACGSENLQENRTIKDYFFSQEIFPIVKCNRCTLLFTQNRPDAFSIGKYYDSTNYTSHNSSKKSAWHILYQTARNFMLNKKFQIIRPFKPELQRILDYGAGDGHFVEYLEKKGKKAEGVEPSEMARQQYYNRTGKHLYADIREVSMEKTFQVITMWHVLEHIHSLKETMQQLIESLEKKGILVIAVPNQSSLDLKDFGNQWAAWDVPRHLYHWNSKSLSEFISSFGLKKIYSGHLPLDPFYIGLISARYAKRSALHGLWTGLHSFLHGNRHPEEGSTLLMIWMKD